MPNFPYTLDLVSVTGLHGDYYTYTVSKQTDLLGESDGGNAFLPVTWVDGTDLTGQSIILDYKDDNDKKLPRFDLLDDYYVDIIIDNGLSVYLYQSISVLYFHSQQPETSPIHFRKESKEVPPFPQYTSGKLKIKFPQLIDPPERDADAMLIDRMKCDVLETRKKFETDDRDRYLILGNHRATSTPRDMFLVKIDGVNSGIVTGENALQVDEFLGGDQYPYTQIITSSHSREIQTAKITELSIGYTEPNGKLKELTLHRKVI